MTANSSRKTMRERASESSEPGQTKRRTAARRPRAQAAEPPLVVATALDPLDPSVEPRRRGGRRKRGIPAPPSAQLRDACVSLCLTNGWSPSGAEVERLVRLRAEVAGGRRNDTALDHRRLSFARWLVEHGRLSETSD